MIFYSYYMNTILIYSSSQFSYFFFFLNDTPPPEIYTLPLHDALPISVHRRRIARSAARRPHEPARSGTRDGRDALGSRTLGRAAVRARRIDRRHHPRSRPRAGREIGRAHV